MSQHSVNSFFQKNIKRFLRKDCLIIFKKVLTSFSKRVFSDPQHILTKAKTIF